MEESLSAVKTRSRGKQNGPLPSNAKPFMGRSTRSNSRMSFLPNPSAVSRPDALPSESITDTEPVEAFLSSDASGISSIKDLRMKRVFTPEVNSIPEEETEEERIEDRKKLKVSDPDPDHLKVNEVKVEYARNDTAMDGLNSKDQEASGNGSLTISKMALNRCNRRKFFKTANSFSYRRMLPYLMDIANDASSVSKIEIVDGVNSEVRSTPENTCAVKIEGDGLKPSENQDKNHMNGVDVSMEEEHIQTTPPEPGVFAKTAFDNGAESLEANRLISENQTFMGLKSPNTKCSSNSTNKMVLNPCSRLRLFNNPRSHSFRRLLPFLMDISKDNSCATTNTHHPILQKSVLEKDNNVNRIKAENSWEKPPTQDASSTVPLPPSDISSLDANDILVSSMRDSSNLESHAATLEALPEDISQTQSSPANSELVLELKDSTSQSEPSSIINNDVLTEQCASEEPESVGNQKMSLDMGLELHNSNAESIETVGFKQSPIQVKESSEVFICPNNRPSKGILKRNPLGCRGLCNCLNCASFRLHAERAFEFSRNQMHNAEEVASELMEELANLRTLLEESITKNNDPDLVKQACKKALEAEKMAKERLIELNNDLGAHCRIPALVQPKVTFANNIQERAIQAMDPSTSTE